MANFFRTALILKTKPWTNRLPLRYLKQFLVEQTLPQFRWKDFEHLKYLFQRAFLPKNY